MAADLGGHARHGGRLGAPQPEGVHAQHHAGGQAYADPRGRAGPARVRRGRGEVRGQGRDTQDGVPLLAVDRTGLLGPRTGDVLGRADGGEHARPGQQRPQLRRGGGHGHRAPAVPDQEPTAVVVMLHPLHRGGLQGAGGDEARGLGGLPGVGRAGRGDLLHRAGVQPEHHLRDQGEAAQRAVEELGQVVPGDVLDHVAAGAGDGAVGQDHGDPDDEVAEVAVAQPGRAGVPGREQAADGGARGLGRWVEGEPLAVSGELGLQVGQRRAGLHRRGHVRRRVVEHRRHAAGVDGEVGGRDGPRPAEAGAGTTEQERALGAAQQLRRLGHRGGAFHPRRPGPRGRGPQVGHRLVPAPLTCARSGRRPRAGGPRTSPVVRRRAGAWGRACRGC